MLQGSRSCCLRRSLPRRPALSFSPVAGMQPAAASHIDNRPASSAAAASTSSVNQAQRGHAHQTSAVQGQGTTKPWFVIAVDGPAAAGKGTLCKSVAAKWQCRHLDTGTLYRSVGYKALAQGVALTDETTLATISTSLTPEDLSSPGLRTDEAAAAASKVSSLPAVRAALLDYQRSFAASPVEGWQGSVLDGRDIGTMVCPDADVKVFVTASPETRARRRWEELRVKPGMADLAFETVLQDLKERDQRDSSRKDSPLRPADDALQLDTSDLDAAGALAAVAQHIERVCPGLRALQSVPA